MRKKNLAIIAIILCLYLLNKAGVLDFGGNEINALRISYFNDVLCGIFFPAYCNFFIEMKYAPITSFLFIEMGLLVCGLFWEYVTPMYLSSSTSDLADLFAYLLGGFIYWCLFRFLFVKKNRKLKN